MEGKKPNFKAEITRPIEIHIKGHSTYRTAETEEEAQRIAKEMEIAAGKEWDKNYGREARALQEDSYIRDNIRRYLDHLKKRLWHLTRNKSVSKEKIEEIKNIRETLSGIYYGTKKVNWHQSYTGGVDSYTIDAVEDYDRK